MAWLFLIVVCGIAALFSLDLYFLKVARKKYILMLPVKVRRHLFKAYAKGFWAWGKQCIKKVWSWCKFLLENPANLFLALAGLLILIALAVFGFDVYKIYVVLSDQIKGNEVIPDDYRSIAIRYFGIIAAVGAVIGYIIAIARNITANNQNQINQQGQITESMVQAIAQIGAVNDKKPNIEVRLGGLYSLQRIMQDSPKDELSIAKIFYAYVRENAKKIKIGVITPPAREDVQAALDIIGQFHKEWEKQGKGFSLDSRINLSRSNLTRYSFANMDLSNSILEDADLSGVELETRSLSSINLSNADLSGAYLYGIDLSDADLSGANLSGASLYHVYFTDSNLFGVDLSNTILSDSNFHGAIIDEANLSGVDLSSAMDLTQMQIDSAEGDEDTKLPEGLIRPNHWKQKRAKIDTERLRRLGQKD